MIKYFRMTWRNEKTTTILTEEFPHLFTIEIFYSHFLLTSSPSIFSQNGQINFTFKTSLTVISFRGGKKICVSVVITVHSRRTSLSTPGNLLKFFLMTLLVFHRKLFFKFFDIIWLSNQKINQMTNKYLKQIVIIMSK